MFALFAMLLPLLLVLPPLDYLCSKVSQPPVIDGDLDEPAWAAAGWTSAFVDIEGSAKPHPRLATAAKMAWDDHAFYIGAAMEEPHVWATLTEHDSVIYHDNDFEVFLDPNGDTKLYAELEINALNTTWDLLLVKPYREGGPALDGWEIKGLRTAVAITGTLNNHKDVDHGWSVEIAIPWRALREIAGTDCPPKPGDAWRINFSRVQWPVEITEEGYKKPAGAKENNWVWSPQGVVDMHQPEQWGTVKFVEP